MEIDFEKGNGLVPAIIQDANTLKVLMLGYMNREAYMKTVTGNKVTFYSRTKNRLWTKGEESGNFLNVVSIRSDCDNDTLLIKASPEGPVCHTGADTCWNEPNKKSGIDFLLHLEEVILQRKESGDNSSYTARLFKQGIPKIAQKVGEEAVETVVEAMRNRDDLFIEESSDLIYHFLVLLQAKGFRLADVSGQLEKRHKP
jgi:phosphoribosyl-AMP cyclohydrolase / phosphoribosyl-ATP pyrophosphohydrolase